VNNFKAAQARLDVAFENGQSIAMLNSFAVSNPIAPAHAGWGTI
jgi:hypothetical protein